MKTLFEKTLEFNDEGIRLSESFQKLLDDWFDMNNITQYNPIEISWLINNEISIKIAGMYLDNVYENMEYY